MFEDDIRKVFLSLCIVGISISATSFPLIIIGLHLFKNYTATEQNPATDYVSYKKCEHACSFVFAKRHMRASDELNREKKTKKKSTSVGYW